MTGKVSTAYMGGRRWSDEPPVTQRECRPHRPTRERNRHDESHTCHVLMGSHAWSHRACDVGSSADVGR